MPKNPLCYFGAPWWPFWILQAVRRCRRLASAPFATRLVFILCLFWNILFSSMIPNTMLNRLITSFIISIDSNIKQICIPYSTTKESHKQTGCLSVQCTGNILYNQALKVRSPENWALNNFWAQSGSCDGDIDRLGAWPWKSRSLKRFVHPPPPQTSDWSNGGL